MANYNYSTPYKGMSGGPLPPGYLEAAMKPGENLAQGIRDIGKSIGRYVEGNQKKKGIIAMVKEYLPPGPETKTFINGLGGMNIHEVEGAAKGLLERIVADKVEEDRILKNNYVRAQTAAMEQGTKQNIAEASPLPDIPTTREEVDIPAQEVAQRIADLTGLAGRVANRPQQSNAPIPSGGSFPGVADGTPVYFRKNTPQTPSNPAAGAYTMDKFNVPDVTKSVPLTDSEMRKASIDTILNIPNVTPEKRAQMFELVSTKFGGLNQLEPMRMPDGKLSGLVRTSDGKIIPLPTAKSLTESESNSLIFSVRMAENERNIKRLLDSGYTAAGTKANTWSPELLKSEDRKSYETAKQNWISAVLRKESGAAISDEEYARAESDYFPKLGDPKSVIEQKRKLRGKAFNAMKAIVGPSVKEYDALYEPEVSAEATVKDYTGDKRL
jgi:hypothetical protein